jgi:plastocyanin
MKLISRIVLFLIPAVVAGALVACGGSSNDSSSSGAGDATATRPPGATQATPTAATGGAATSNTLDVTIQNFAFTPANITVRAGQPVTLNVTNKDSASHTLTLQGVAGADTGTLSQNGAKTITFTPSAAGRIAFFCNIHGASAMSGAIIVQ